MTQQQKQGLNCGRQVVACGILFPGQGSFEPGPPVSRARGLSHELPRKSQEAHFLKLSIYQQLFLPCQFLLYKFMLFYFVLNQMNYYFVSIVNLQKHPGIIIYCLTLLLPCCLSQLFMYLALLFSFSGLFRGISLFWFLR